MGIEREIVGLIPAAGMGTRVSPLPGSKELFPVGFREVELNGHIELRPKVISQYLIDNMFNAGAQKVWMVLGKGKWDVMQYYGDGGEFGGPMAYLLMDRLWGMPFTLDQAHPFIGGATVLFGMPDTIFTPHDAFALMLRHHDRSEAAVTLGVFHTDQPQKLSVVRMDSGSNVTEIIDKPKTTDLMQTWGCACWTPEFTEFMHTYLMRISPPEQEVVLASVFVEAMNAGMRVIGHYFKDGEYIDIGTPDDLVVAVHRFSKRV